MAIGKVIKGDAPEPSFDRERSPAPRRVVSGEEYEASQKAKSIIEEAERKAQEVLRQADVEREARLKEGFEKGREEGKASVTAELTRAKLNAGQMLEEAQRDILALALKVAEKIIGADVERDPRVLAQMCAQAIETVRSAKSLVVRVHPTMGARLRGSNVFSELLGKSVDLTLKDDAEVEPLGCVIQTEFGTVDAQLKEQMKMLHEVLLPDSGKREGPA